MSTFLSIKQLHKSFGDHKVVNGIQIDIEKEEFIAFLGPSGCGKTTTLRMIAGFVGIDEGEVWLEGRRIDNLPARSRQTAMVFQDYALYPHMTVAENVGFGLKMRKVQAAERSARIDKALATVKLDHVKDKYPNELSGGMKQRVAVARAIVVEPKVLLLDEPLSNLDAKLRKELRQSLRELHNEIGITTILVTHDLEEAFFLADRVVLMNGGSVEQAAAPEEMFSRPATKFVADFVGHENMLHGHAGDAPGEFISGTLTSRSMDPVPDSANIMILPPHLHTLSRNQPRDRLAAPGGLRPPLRRRSCRLRR
jgi:putative spermidine/putrescine transport system ATP-binding protein